jgi:hypothetical protein
MGAMTLTLVMVFAILAALVLGFLCGRIWQIRSDELQRLRIGSTLSLET